MTLYQQFSENQEKVLTKDAIFLNKKLKQEIENNSISCILSELDKYGKGIIPSINKKVLLGIIPKNLINASVTKKIYQKLASYKLYGKIKYKFNRKNYRKVYVIFYDLISYPQKILKSIARKQHSESTKFQYCKYCNTKEKLFSLHHNYKLALESYGYNIHMYTFWRPYEIEISLG